MIISMEVVGGDTLPPMKVMGIALCIFTAQGFFKHSNGDEQASLQDKLLDLVKGHQLLCMLTFKAQSTN